jgi:hypothetical protein
MAILQSPGALVTVIDESFYTPAAPGTVPILFVATAQDKTTPGGGIAQGTTAANSGKIYVITSQRDLVDTFGSPRFYTDTSGNPVHGNELNEYGLQAAYSLLGVSSRAYIARANIDLGQLIPTTSIPTGSPAANTYWIDSDNSLYGVFEWDPTLKSGRGDFVAKTPLIIDDTNVDTVTDNGIPVAGRLGEAIGDYAMVVTKDNENTLWYRSTSSWETVGSTNWLYAVNTTTDKTLKISPHTDYPNFSSTTTSGSIWIKTTTPGKGANWNIKYYSGSTQTWNTVSAPIYSSTQQALQKLDFTGGGKNLTVGSLFIESDYKHAITSTATFKVWRRNAPGATVVTSTAVAVDNTSTTATTFVIRETLAGATDWSGSATIYVPGWNAAKNSIGKNIATAIIVSTMTNISASYNDITKKLTISHLLGGDFELKDGTTGILKTIGITTGTTNLYNSPDGAFDFLASNWKPLGYQAKTSTPYTTPTNGRLWYDTNLGEVDIMVNTGTAWAGYLTQYSDTDPAGPIVSALEPTTQSDGTELKNNDIWVSTADTDRYGKDVYVYNADSKKWNLQNTKDQSSPDGWVFANARWSTSGADKDPATIVNLLSSSYVDPDAPDPTLYPKGIKLWNLRRSGYNVKQYTVGAIDTTAKNNRYKKEDMANYNPNRWTCISGTNEDGSGVFGRLAQRKMVVRELKAFIDVNTGIRDTDTLTFNLVATPGYPETIANMVAFNTDIGQTAFVVGDSPFRLKPNATDLAAWGKNTVNAYDNGEDGLVTHDEYLGVFYPSGYTTDNTGKNIVVPPSHMMLRTITNSDAKSYPWFAPAGTRRGGVDNATSVGYIDGEGEFKTVALYQALRDVLQNPTEKIAINPIATLPGVGLVNYGQQTRAKNASALDRINVVRLVAYLRRQLSILAKPYLFEPNDSQTRREIKSAAESLLIELVGQRALYDFIVVCDTSNNTPARIDRSELYMDIAIEPVKAVEFIYIPLRIKNTGEIASGK